MQCAEQLLHCEERTYMARDVAPYGPHACLLQIYCAVHAHAPGAGHLQGAGQRGHSGAGWAHAGV
jgi:hypothetical protein